MGDQIKSIRLNIDSSYDGFFDDLYNFGKPSLIGGKEYVATSLTRTPWGAKAELVQVQTPEIAWTGEGLPPVGTVCEWRDDDSGSWVKVELRYLSEHTALLRFDLPCGGDSEGAYSPTDCQFRPIRTPEQIAAEVRDREIADLYFTINWNEGRETWPIISGSRKADYAKAIDAGYRKFEITDDSDPA
jgi:hypothetical protein